jgi:hypothetical protein
MLASVLGRWRNIAITLIEAQKGEQKAHACAIACSIKGNVKENISLHIPDDVNRKSGAM